MSRRNLILRKELQNLKNQIGTKYPDFTITLDFGRSSDDTERLTGFPAFLSAIFEITPDTEIWKWSEEQVQLACDKSGMNRKSIILENEPRNQMFYIKNRR